MLPEAGARPGKLGEPRGTLAALGLYRTGHFNHNFSMLVGFTKFRI